MSSFERREEFADIARRNVGQFFGAAEGESHPAWTLTVGDLVESPARRREARAASTGWCSTCWRPWECVDVVADALAPGGIVVAYVATTTQLGRIVETLRAHGEFTEPQPWETLVRDWHVEGLAVRPGHKMNGHTGFLVTARRMAPGQHRAGQEAASCPRRLRTPTTTDRARPGMPPDRRRVCGMLQIAQRNVSDTRR